MKLIKNEKNENNKHELHFEIDADTFKKGVDTAYKSTADKYNIPGFRKGKAPRAMIEKMYGEDVFYIDAINELFADAYEAAIEESGIEPVDRPEADIVSASLDDGLVLKVLVTVKPDVKIGTYKGLKVTKLVKAVKDADVDAEIERMRERSARIITREDAAQDGDITDLDFEGFIDDVPFEGGKGEHFSLTLGSGQFIPGFEEQVVGHKAGEEFDVKVTFPEGYQAEELANKEAVFKIKLHEVKMKELPELDDEFAKDVSEYDTLAELKDSIRNNMQEQIDAQALTDIENSLVEQVVETLEADIPKVMVENRIDEMVRDFEQRLQQQGLKLEDYLKYMGGEVEKFREGFAEQAEKQVKTRLALESIVAQEKIEALEEDFDKEVERIAEAYKMEADKVKGLLPKAEIMKDLAVNKAIDLLKSHAEVEEKEHTEEENKDGE